MRKVLCIILIIAMCLSLCGCMSGCQGAARDLGGEVTIELPPNEKLEVITWKEDSLWYLTRPMREGEEAETHIYKQSSEWGVFEGTVTIIETKTD